MLRLTGEARFAEQLEHVILNQLLGAQRPDGSGWGYYVQMEGKKPYSSNLDGHCCLSSGPRGLALIPTFAITTDSDGVVVNLYDAGLASLSLRDGTPATVTIDGAFPSDPRVSIRVDSPSKKPFMVKMRKPGWSSSTLLRINGRVVPEPPEIDGYLALTRSWHRHDVIDIEFSLQPRMIVGDHLNEARSPCSTAAGAGRRHTRWAIHQPRLQNHRRGRETIGQPRTFLVEPAPGPFQTWPGLRSSASTASSAAPPALSGRLSPAHPPRALRRRRLRRREYKVWLPVGLVATPNLLFEAAESRSRKGNLYASMTDDDPSTAVDTLTVGRPPEDWYAATPAEPAPSPASSSCMALPATTAVGLMPAPASPKIQAKTSADGEWQTLGELQEYPATTASDPAGLKDGQAFTFKLPTTEKILPCASSANRPAGDNPKQAFSSCAELQAFRDK